MPESSANEHAVPACCTSILAGPDAMTEASAGRWSPIAIARLARHLNGAGAAALAALTDDELLNAWSATVAAFRDPDSPERRALALPLARRCMLSPAGLAAGLEAVLGGLAGEPAAAVLAGAHWPGATAGAADRLPPRPSQRGLALVVLAGNIPGLAAQPLLPLLALRRPTLLKSSSTEPLFAPAFVTALARRQPALGEAIAAVTWPGGDEAIEAPLLGLAEKILAYGDAPAIASLERRAPGKVLAYGPKASVAAIGAEVDPVAVAPGLARDIALFDQRGCLSVQAIWTAGDPQALAVALAAELRRIALLWPPGAIDPAVAAAVQQVRLEADLRGLTRLELPLSAGTVIVESELAFRPSPGLRTVRIHPLADLSRLAAILAPWRGQLQGAALSGAAAVALAAELAALGLSRCTPPGELQSPTATWHNGGIDPLLALA